MSIMVFRDLIKTEDKMLIVEYIFLAVLLLASIFIIVAVTLQKSEKDGLSATIKGGSETYYGRNKAVHTDKVLKMWTLIIGTVFVLAVLLVYVIQPDYTQSYNNLDYWQKISEYSSIFS